MKGKALIACLVLLSSCETLKNLPPITLPDIHVTIQADEAPPNIALPSNLDEVPDTLRPIGLVEIFDGETTGYADGTGRSEGKLRAQFVRDVFDELGQRRREDCETFAINWSNLFTNGRRPHTKCSLFGWGRHGAGSLDPNDETTRVLEILKDMPNNPLNLPNPRGRITDEDSQVCQSVHAKCHDWLARTAQLVGLVTPLRRFDIRPFGIDPGPDMPLEIAQKCVNRELTCRSINPCGPARGPNGEDFQLCNCYIERGGGFWFLNAKRIEFDPTRPECTPSVVVTIQETPRPPEGWSLPLPPGGKHKYARTNLTVTRDGTATLTVRAYDDKSHKWGARSQVIIARLGALGAPPVCEVVYLPQGDGHPPRLSYNGCSNRGVEPLPRTTAGLLLTVDDSFRIRPGDYVLETSIRSPIEGWPSADPLYHVLDLKIREDVEEPKELSLCDEVLAEIDELVRRVESVCSGRP